MVIVPTAESGRQLRFALAQRHGAKGLLSPRIVQPSHLIQPASLPYPMATKAETYTSLLHFLTTPSPQALHERWPHIFYTTSIETAGFIGLTKQLYDLWEELASKGLTFHDLATTPENRAFFALHAPEEALRWEELADLEAAFNTFIHTQGRCTKSEAYAIAKTAPLPLDKTIDTLLLPALVDPLPLLIPILEAYQKQTPHLNILLLLHANEADRHMFDDWGRPTVEAWTDQTTLNALHLETYLPTEAITLYPQDEDLAEAVACHCLSAAPNLPQLSILDERLFHPIKLAIERHTEEFTLHNPSLYPLAQSALGRLTLNLLSLLQAPTCYPWEAFAAFLHCEDVLTFLTTHAGLCRNDLLAELTTYQNTLLPQAIDATFAQSDTYPALTQALATLRPLLTPEGSLIQTMRAFFRTLFQGRVLRPAAEDKECCNAIHALTDLFNAFDTPFTASLSSNDFQLLFSTLLKQTSYPLETNDSNARRTVGWLELPWVDTPTLHLAGFNETVVPDTLVGHPFLPDTLRAHLGLAHNDQRLARDTFLFSELLRARTSGDVKLAISLATPKGDPLKPSRLLFLCDNATFVQRVQKLFDEVSTVRPMSHLQLPEAWRFNLTLPRDTRPVATISASALDDYLQCPFTYYLRRVLKMQPKGSIKEFDAATFGNVVHAILCQFATSEAKKSEDPKVIFATLEALLQKEETRLALQHTKVLDLFISNIRQLLFHFAEAQAEIRRQGWEICHVEYQLKLPDQTPLFDDLPFGARGTIDRIDYHPVKDIYRIIDYKTWEKEATTKVKELLFVTHKATLNAMADQGYPLLTLHDDKQGNPSFCTMRSIQLNFYKHILEKANPERYLLPGSTKSRIQELAYFTLNTQKATLALQPQCVSCHEAIVAFMHHALSRLLNNHFWPPMPPFGAHAQWAYDYAHLFLNSPQEDLPNPDCNPLLSEAQR